MRQSFYGRVRAEGYDIGTEQQTLIDFYLDAWRRAGQPMPVLEPMCGTGINLIPFLEAGAVIDGVDASPAMLAQCRKKCAASGLQPNLYEQFLEAMALPRQYAFVFIPGASFGHLYDKAVAQMCLQRLAEHLLPGGLLVLDVRPPAYRSNFPKPGHTEFELEDRGEDETIFTTTVWGERDAGRVILCWNKYESYVDGKLIETEIFDYHERFYDRAEFVNMLQSAGFARPTVTKAWEVDTEPDENDWMVFSCRKP